MDFFDVLELIGGLCLFLFGMDVMGQALERRAGNSLSALIGKLTTNRIAGFLTGLGVTAVIRVLPPLQLWRQVSLTRGL